MQEQHISVIARELKITEKQVGATASLLHEEATVPFIARYRKEATDSLDEVAIANIRDRLIQLRELDKRREAILKSLEDRELLSDELKEKILAAETMTILEDIYLPFRPKRRTRATVAREKGLEPLAQLLFEQEDIDPLAEAEPFVDAEKEVANAEDALAGARDIMAEWVNEDQIARAEVRELFNTKAVVRSKVLEGKDEEGIKFKDYYNWEESVTDAPSHRILAMRRGENEGVLSLTITPDEEDALAILYRIFVKGDNAASEQVRMAVQDSYKRLLSLSMETEIRTFSKSRADAEAIEVFTENLRELLLASPLGSKNVLALDPAFRTGCKVVCLDRQGKLVHTDTIFPHTGEKKRQEAEKTIIGLCEEYQIEAVAIGNGTASRETESFVRALSLPHSPMVVLVNESGASVYSASKTARDEFPDQDVTVRGSVSIGRRLMDPLAELVKIDPKSIGVGQYQHDVDQGELKKSLDDVVVSCVNNVGVEVNTASSALLSYVSGVGPNLAKSIVDYREKNGPFSSRKDLLQIPRLGPKVFEQAAGFLRIRDGENPLDASAVHPESYGIVDLMTQDLGTTITDLIKDSALREKIELEKYTTETVGLPTLTDIVEELARPGRDPRDQFENVQFAEGIMSIEDVKPGMKLQGVVTNVTAFGAFVDIGVHQDGLVHISQLANNYVKHASDAVKVNQKVTATVMEVDIARKRISLSLRDNPDQPRKGASERKKSDKPRHEGAKGQGNEANKRKQKSNKQEAPKKQEKPTKPATIDQLMKQFGGSL